LPVGTHDTCQKYADAKIMLMCAWFEIKDAAIQDLIALAGDDPQPDPHAFLKRIEECQEVTTKVVLPTDLKASIQHSQVSSSDPET
jgi:hypothetical protein